MDRILTRREFLKISAAGAMGACLPLGTAMAATGEPLPARLLGKTGIQVPIIGFGTAPVGTTRNLEQAIALYNAALDLGINYFDTAPEFAGYGKAQVQLGHAFKGRRKDVFLVTKCFKPKADDALRLLESNLRELQTDHADLVYAHSLGADEMDPKLVTGPGGVMEFLTKAKRDGLARFVGITGHNRPDRFLPVLRDFDIDVMMNAVNFVDRNTYNFEEKVWPVAAERKVALVAMKVFGGGKDAAANSLMPVEHHENAFRYALSLPNVSCAVLGMKNMDELNRNIQWVRSFKPLSRDEMTALQETGKTLAAQWKQHLGTIT